MQKWIVKILKLVVSIAIVSMFVWFLVLSPMLTFHSNEKKIENAAKRYFELNSDKLPTGERVKTLSLNTLYKQSYLKEGMGLGYAQESKQIVGTYANKTCLFYLL